MMSGRPMAKSKARTKRGVYMVEAPIAMWLVFVFLLMPFVIMGSLALRTAFLYSAAKDGAHAAARAKTYSLGTAERPAAVVEAKESAERTGHSFTGVEIVSVDTKIVETNLSSGAESFVAGPLAQPADVSKNLYQLQVTVQANVEPLIRYQLPFFGDVPGLTSAMKLTAVASEMVENPDGLNK